MADVTQLKVMNAPTIDTADLCDRLREIIERIEKGEFGASYKAVLVIEATERGVVSFARGAEAFTTASAIGLLEVAKWQMIDDLD